MRNLSCALVLAGATLLAAEGCLGPEAVTAGPPGDTHSTMEPSNGDAGIPGEGDAGSVGAQDAGSSDSGSPDGGASRQDAGSADAGARDAGVDPCAGAPRWSLGWDLQKRLRVDVGAPVAGSVGNVLTLQSTEAAGTLALSFNRTTGIKPRCSPAGISTCGPCDLLLADGVIDGYAGKVPTGNTCTAPGACGAGGSLLVVDDLGFRNVVLKNLTLKNAFSHDTTESPAPLNVFGSVQNGGWLVVQDSVLENGDFDRIFLRLSGQGLSGSACAAPPTIGVLLQNVTIRSSALFESESTKRGQTSRGSDYFNLNPGAAVSTLWLVNVKLVGTPNLFIVTSNGGFSSGLWKKIVVVGPQPNLLFSASPPTGGVHTYPSLEAAIQTEGEPPFVRLSPSGWTNAPSYNHCP